GVVVAASPHAPPGPPPPPGGGAPPPLLTARAPPFSGPRPGGPPSPPQNNAAQDMFFRLKQPPPSARAVRPEVPAELDALVTRLMAVNPDDRYPSAQAVMRALLPFLKSELSDGVLLPAERPSAAQAAAGLSEGARVHRVLIVDDEAGVRKVCRYALESDELTCDEAANGMLALEALRQKGYDLVLLDIDMPQLSGKEVCRRLREEPPCPHLKIIMFSGRATGDERAQLQITGGADDLTKPLSRTQLRGRVKAALRLKDAQDRSGALNRELLAINQELERNLNARSSDLIHTRNGLVLALAKLVECRDGES